MTTQFYATSRGFIHVADNPNEMKCGARLKVAGSPLGGDLRQHRHSRWGCVESGGETYMFTCGRCRYKHAERDNPPPPPDYLNFSIRAEGVTNW